jgi:predicted nuclease of predicted toxin-antitoxin system
MILADENIDHSLIEAIREIGIEVLSIYEMNRGIKDEFIIELSRNPPRIILTEDKDFGEWVFAMSAILVYCFFDMTSKIPLR